MTRQTRTGMDELRTAVKALDNCREDFLDRFTSLQLLRLWRAWVASDWDIYPDQWAPRQVHEALRGHAPCFDENEKPTYPERRP